MVYPMVGLAVCLTLITSLAMGQEKKADAKPWERKVLFGEQHLYTSASPDAFAIGMRSTWDDAYRYAMGEEVKLSTTGEKMKKSTPYDFVAITDHAEYFGVMPRLIDPKDPLSKTPFGKELQKPTVPASDPKSAINQILHSILTSAAMPEYVKPEMLASNWKKYVDTANKYNKPGVFTALIAFEWTSIPNGRNRRACCIITGKCLRSGGDLSAEDRRCQGEYCSDTGL